MKKKKRNNTLRFDVTSEEGLTALQVAQRIESGDVNTPLKSATKSVWKIIRNNVFTYFNLLFFILAGVLVAVGALRQLIFMPVVLANMLIGIIQELRSKRTLDKLSLLSEQKIKVVREGREEIISTSKLVLDDVVIFVAGNQICADATILKGEAQVNEALITGEADEISKKPSDELLSGSFIVAGQCWARLDRVGANSFASQLTLAAKKQQNNKQSEMLKSLTRLIQIVGVLIIPLGLLLFYNQYYILKDPLKESVVGTVGALVGMIPEGLYLLTTIALSIGVMRLSKKNTLVHDLNCIETLARVNVLCVDKTGTITEPQMMVEDVILLAPQDFSDIDIETIMSDYLANLSRDNETMNALAQRFKNNSEFRAKDVIPFSSTTKYAGIVREEGTAYLVGAPEILLGNNHAMQKTIDTHSDKGYRVILLAKYTGKLPSENLNVAQMMPIALILLSNKIRENAPETFQFFEEQGVSIRVISGDNPMTVSNISQKANIANAEKYIDARELKDDTDIQEAVKKYTVFGRVTPEQKQKIISALKKEGNIVAMTGDGVNDVLALKEADCSIAMASGSDVACQVSNLVLMDSDFSSMPSVVMEGRCVINNIERSASLFLVKNIFSFVMTLLALIFVLPYPITPAALSLMSIVAIGVPSFLLALEHNESIIKGHFLRNVIMRALPTGITDVVLVIMALLFGYAFSIDKKMISTIYSILLAFVGIVLVFRISRPQNAFRWCVCILIVILMVVSVVFFKVIFVLSPLNDLGSVLVLVTLCLLSNPMIEALEKLFKKIGQIYGFIFKRRK